MRTTLRQDVIYDYRQLNMKDEVKCHLRDTFFSRRDYMPPQEDDYTTSDRLLILASIVTGAACLYCLLSYIV